MTISIIITENPVSTGRQYNYNKDIPKYKYRQIQKNRQKNNRDYDTILSKLVFSVYCEK
jgi:hypothetical protein